MINRATGEVNFRSGLHFSPQCALDSLSTHSKEALNIKSQRLSVKPWTRHLFGVHISEHGFFEVEALSAGDDRIHLVLLSHLHKFYERGTPGDAERRVFHEGIINSDLTGQREFPWGEVFCRLEAPSNRDWLVAAYHREVNVPFPVKEVLSHLRAHEKTPEDNLG